MSHLPPPPESSSIDAGLRTRLEGKVELLEDSIALFDSVVNALNREEIGRDDLDTLREAVSQLPRVERAVEQLRAHDGTAPLIALVEKRRQWAMDAVTLKCAEPPLSLKEGLRLVLNRLQREGLTPTPEETVLAASEGPSNALPLVASVVGSLGLAFAFASPWGLVAAPIAWLGVKALRPAAREWVLLPDRIYFAAFDGKAALNVELNQLRVLGLVSGGVEIEFRGERLLLKSGDAGGLLTTLLLASSSWLSGLETRPQPTVTLSAVETDGERGFALLSAEGVLFLRADRVDLARGALVVRTCSPPTLERLFELIAHLPRGRWNAVGELLETRADARWFAKGEVRFERSANELIGVSVGRSRDAVGVRLIYPAPKSGDQTQVIAEGLIERLR